MKMRMRYDYVHVLILREILLYGFNHTLTKVPDGVIAVAVAE